jgi:hypothetical protein
LMQQTIQFQRTKYRGGSHENGRSLRDPEAPRIVMKLRYKNEFKHEIFCRVRLYALPRVYSTNAKQMRFLYMVSRLIVTI